MSDFTNKLSSTFRAGLYKLYRMTKPAGWVHDLTDEELEREVSRWYFATCGDHMDFAHPKSFSQKMQWLKIHDKDPRKTVLSDKLAVREVIEDKLGDKVLTKLYGRWQDPQEIDFTGLPKSFFLKCNNGSGMMMRIEDSAQVDMGLVRKNAAKWIAHDFAAQYFEMHYADIISEVYAEEWIDDIEWEYQAWCFSGKVAFIAAIHDPHGKNEKQFFSPTWEKLPFVSSPPEYQGTIEAPEELSTILSWSEQLADDFTFVRVDWYGTRHGLMFSEMSFTPAYGIVKWVPSEQNIKVGELIHLPIEG